MFSKFLLSYRNNCEGLGELDKFVETFASSSFPTAFLIPQTSTCAVADPDLERGGGWGEGNLLVLLAFLLSVISSFVTQNKGAPPLDPPLLCFYNYSIETQLHVFYFLITTIKITIQLQYTKNHSYLTV